MGYKNDPISKVVKRISGDKYVLPVIQRGVVWSAEQIENLFDSIMSGYPIGSMLFWNYSRDPEIEYKFYRFLKKYDQYEKNYNDEFDTKGVEDLTAILDGQQRLTALYIGLKGYLNLHIARHRWDKAENYEKKYLYINLLYKQDKNSESITNKYEFKFKTEESANKDNLTGDYYWFKVGNILDFKTDKDYRKVLGNFYYKVCEQTREDVRDIFQDLYQKLMKDEIINYFEVNESDFDKVLQIFVRINSGGTPLGYTDLLMSIISNFWQDARDKVEETLKSINSDYGFDIPKDIFLRGCLFLSDLKLTFKVKYFNNSNVEKIQNGFSNIVKYVKASCEIFKDFGYSKENLRSNLIILPLAYFLYSNQNINLEDRNKEKVLKWIQLSILNGAFGGQTTQYLEKLQNIIKNNSNKNEFPLAEIQNASNSMKKQMDINEKTLEDFIDNARYGTQNSWTILTMLYPSLAYGDKIFHEDHIYPSSKLSKEQLDHGGNFVMNLQLLESKKNIKKQDKMPEEWLKDYCKNNNITVEKYKKENFIPNIELTEENFDSFIKKRKEMIKKAIMESFNTI